MDTQLLFPLQEKWGDAKKEQILDALREPFDPELIKWKPQATKGYGENRKGQAAAYADPRAYSDRLNTVIGVGNWAQSSRITISNAFPVAPRKTYRKRGEPDPVYAFEHSEEGTCKGRWTIPSVLVDAFGLMASKKAKLICEVTVQIAGLGIHSDVGESWLDDENAATSAYAQAFKRACYQFGLGRYLYDLPKQWLPMNEEGWAEEPTLPDWALPKYVCEDCTATIVRHGSWSPAAIVEKTMQRFGKKLCVDCMKKRVQAETPGPVEHLCSDCKKPVQPALDAEKREVSVERVVATAVKTFGVELCVPCLRLRKQSQLKAA